MNEIEIVIVAAASLMAVIFACGTAYACGETATREKAVDAGVGEWRCDKYGKLTWHWKGEEK